MSIDWDAVEAALHAWVVSGSGLTTQQVIWSQQPDAARPPEPAIMMKFYVLDNIGMPWVDYEEKFLVFADKTISGVAGNVLTSAAHTLLSGDGPVRFLTTGTLPSPLLTGTDYWIIRDSDNAVRVAATYANTGGNVVVNPITPITLLDAGLGVHTIVDTAGTMRAGQEIRFAARGMIRVGLQLFCHTATGVSMNSAMAVLRRVADRAYLPSQQALLSAVQIGLNSIERIRPLHGAKDAVLFQPRAWTDVHMTMPFEEFEDGTIISRVVGDWHVPPDAAGIPFEIPKP